MIPLPFTCFGFEFINLFCVSCLETILQHLLMSCFGNAEFSQLLLVYFLREWVAFLGAWCPPPAFRSCFVEVSQHSNNILMNLVGGEKFSLSYSSAILGPLLHLSLSCCPVYNKKKNLQLSSVQLLGHVQIFATPWTAA